MFFENKHGGLSFIWTSGKELPAQRQRTNVLEWGCWFIRGIKPKKLSMTEHSKQKVSMAREDVERWLRG